MKTLSQVIRFIMTMIRSLGTNIPVYFRNGFCRVKAKVDTPSERRTMVPWVTSSLMSMIPLAWVRM